MTERQELTPVVFPNSPSLFIKRDSRQYFNQYGHEVKSYKQDFEEFLKYMLLRLKEVNDLSDDNPTFFIVDTLLQKFSQQIDALCYFFKKELGEIHIEQVNHGGDKVIAGVSIEKREREFWQLSKAEETFRRVLHLNKRFDKLSIYLKTISTSLSLDADDFVGAVDRMVRYLKKEYYGEQQHPDTENDDLIRSLLRMEKHVKGFIEYVKTIESLFHLSENERTEQDVIFFNKKVDELADRMKQAFASANS